MSDQPTPPAPGTGLPGRSHHNRMSPARPLARHGRDYWIMFRERWYVGLIVGVLVGGALVFQQMRQPRLFRTSSSLVFTVPQAPIDLKPAPNPSPEIDIESHLVQMGSKQFREYVAASFTAEEKEQLRRPYLIPDAPPSAQPSIESIIAKGVDLAPGNAASTIHVSVTHRDPAAAELLANRFAARYKDFTFDATSTTNNQALQWLEDEELKARQRLEEAQARVQEYRKMHDTVSLGDSQNLVAQNLNAVAAQLIDATRVRIDLETTINQIDAATTSGSDLLQIPAIAGYRSIPALVAGIEQLKSERVMLQDRYLENHPKMQKNAQELESKNAQLQMNVQQAIAELRNSYARAQQHEARLATEKKDAEQKSFELGQISVEYNMLVQQADKLQEMYSKVLSSRQDRMLTSRLDSVNIDVLDRANPGRQVSPSLKKAATQGGLAGTLCLVVFPFILGLRDTRLKAAWEIEQYLGQSLLGEIPAIAGISRKERPHIMSQELDHGASEAFRGLFGQFQLNSQVAFPKIVMISSTLPGEGKSLVANNLAATFAAHGKKTLLVDCDFRRPNLHVYYGKDNACGVMRWLNTTGVLKGPAEEDPDLGILPLKQDFFLLRAGGESRRATEFFGREAFLGLFQALRQQFEVVVLDTPPLGVFPDAMLLSRLCDEVVYVCRFKAVNRSKIRKCLDRLHQTEAVFAGIVLNALPSGKQSAHYDYYGYGSNENKQYKAYYAQRR